MDRRKFLSTAGLFGLGLLWPADGLGIGDASKVTVARLDYGGPTMSARDGGIRRLLLEVEKRTSVAVETDHPTVRPDQEGLFEHPFLTMFGDEKFDPLPAEHIKRLRTYLQSGGFLFIDSAEGVVDGPYMQSVRRMLGRVFPGKKSGPVTADHVLYKSFYLIEDPVGRIDISDKMLSVSDSDRLMAVVNQNDLFGALARDNFGEWVYQVRPGGEKQREMAFRMGINLVMYALCVNYKADQVHVPFILKRRKWKVD